MGSDTLQSVIDLAIQKEEEAYNFYLNLQNNVEDKSAKDTLKYLADEEAGHKAFLVKCKDQMSCDIVLRPDMPVDYKVAENLKQPDIKKNMNSEEVFLVAANRETVRPQFLQGSRGALPQGAGEGTAPEDSQRRDETQGEDGIPLHQYGLRTDGGGMKSSDQVYQ